MRQVLVTSPMLIELPDLEASSRSAFIQLKCGVPEEGSALDSVVFIIYTVDLVGIIEQHGLRSRLYSDDTHIYGYCP